MDAVIENFGTFLNGFGRTLALLGISGTGALILGTIVAGMRISPVARPPLLPWFNSWKAAGLRGVILKAANSRYRPGELTTEWSTVERLSG